MDFTDFGVWSFGVEQSIRLVYYVGVFLDL